MDQNKRKRKMPKKEQNHITPNPALDASGVDQEQNYEETLRNKKKGLSNAFLEILLHFIPRNKHEELKSSRDILEELQKICNKAHDLKA